MQKNQHTNVAHQAQRWLRVVKMIHNTCLIALGVTPWACPASAQSVFVANTGSDNVTVIEAASNAVVDTIPVGTQPRQVEISPDGQRAYVSNQGSDSVSVIDVGSHAVIATVSVGHRPLGLAVSPDNLKVYVTHDSGVDVEFVWVIDTSSLTASPVFSLSNQAVAEGTGATFHPNGSEIWFKNGCGDGCTTRISYPGHVVLGDLPIETAGANANENHFSFVPGTQILYGAHSCGCCGHFDRSQYSPSVLYTGRRYEDELGSAQWTVAAPTGGIVYLARITHCTTPSTVIRKESALADATLATLTIPGIFTEVGAISPDGTRLYITTAIPDGSSPAVTVVDTATMSVVTSIPVGNEPFGIAVSPLSTCAGKADNLLGTFAVNYRYDAAGQFTDQSNPDYTKANPYYGNAIPPGPIFIDAPAGQYKLVVVSGAGCGVWSGDASSGTFLLTGHNPAEIVTFTHSFGQIALYYWDWYAFDNDPTIETTVSVYNVCQNQAPVAKCKSVIASADSNCSSDASIDDGSFDPDGDSITLAQSPAGPYPLGGTTVTLTVTDSRGASSSCATTVTVIDTEPPIVQGLPINNPLDNNVPQVGDNLAAVKDSAGFFQLLATDNCDAAPQIFIRDSASSFVAGPFANGDRVKITQAPGVTPKSIPMASRFVTHILLNGRALLYAVDASGNQSALNQVTSQHK